ncbi:MAG: hypothetical protein VB133_09130 [Anaeromusa sp.]|uniref:hypothetical protein n=1 Tax=Anaeromusa sp. TaxID=1872520 RepID=UPI002B203ADC|nr:hypothetical protein [Anaeromusa sp.]MEA4835285.1 hypothetical protein [Anaeromusa sp.]
MKDKLREFKRGLPSPWLVIFSTMFFNTLFFFISHVPFILQWLASSLFELSFLYLVVYWLLPTPYPIVDEPTQPRSPKQIRQWQEYDRNYRYWKQIRKE